MRQLCSNGTHTLPSASYHTASKTRNNPWAAETRLVLQTSLLHHALKEYFFTTKSGGMIFIAFSFSLQQQLLLIRVTTRTTTATDDSLILDDNNNGLQQNQCGIFQLLSEPRTFDSQSCPGLPVMLMQGKLFGYMAEGEEVKVFHWVTGNNLWIPNV